MDTLTVCLRLQVTKKVKELKGEKVKELKPKMTAEQKACLAACKSFDADVERAKYISDIADCVLRDMCTTCDHRESCADDRKKIGCLSTLNCRMAAIASVTAGIITKGGVK